MWWILLWSLKLIDMDKKNTTSYNPIYFAPLFAVEDKHFWFYARNQVIAKLVSQITANITTKYQVLEVGCGTGNTLRIVKEACLHGIVTGMDLFAEGLSYARQRTSSFLVQGDMFRPPFGTQFDLICLFDVLEHLPNDKQVLDNLYSMLASNGTLLLTVPAHPELWSYFDESSHHCRRYEPTELQHKLISAGYEIEYLTQYMATIFPLVYIGRKLAKLTNNNKKQVDNLALNELRIIPLLNELLIKLLSWEVHTIQNRRQLYIGTSLLAVVRKK